jgi:N-acetylneuraminic acid mutarotase
MNKTTEDILTQKIRDQEQQIAQLTQLLCAAEHENAARVIGHLRANGTILLHLGQDFDTYVQTLQNGTITANPQDLIAQTYSLQAAPISHDLKAQIRIAANYGETKWPS